MKDIKDNIRRLLLLEESKSNCYTINDLIVKLGGPFTDSCFCSRVQRHEFFKQSENWLNDFEKSKGLGDSIEKITEFFGVKSCDACKLRRDFLNKIFTYK